MSNHELPENGVDRVQALFARAKGETLQDPAQLEDNERPKIRIVRKAGIGRTAVAAVFAGALVAAPVVATGGFLFNINVAAHAVNIKAVTNAGAADNGKSEITKLDMAMPAAVVATAETTNEGHPLEIDLNREVAANVLDWLKVAIPMGTDSIQRQAVVSDPLQFNPTSVQVSINPKNKQIIYDVPNISLSATPTVEADNPNTKDVGSTDSLVTYFNNALGGSDARMFDGFMKSIHVNTDVTSLPYISSLVQKNMTTANVLETYANLKIEQGVGTQCTPLFKDIPGFQNGIENNIRTVMKGELLSDNAPQAVKDAFNDIPVKSVAEAQAIMTNMADHAQVILPTDLKIAVNGDLDNKLAELTKVNAFTLQPDKKPMKCGIGKMVVATGGQANG